MSKKKGCVWCVVLWGGCHSVVVWVIYQQWVVCLFLMLSILSLCPGLWFSDLAGVFISCSLLSALDLLRNIASFCIPYLLFRRYSNHAGGVFGSLTGSSPGSTHWNYTPSALNLEGL